MVLQPNWERVTQILYWKKNHPFGVILNQLFMLFKSDYCLKYSCLCQMNACLYKGITARFQI